MTLNSTIIAAGYRESNFTAQGGTLTAEEQTEGLALLQSLTDSFFGLIVGTRPKAWYIPSPNNTSPDAVSYPADTVADVRGTRDERYPPANSRVILRTTTPQTIYFQTMPQDGAMMQIVDSGFQADVTLDANGVFFGVSGTDTTETLTTSFSGGSRVPTRTYVYRGDLAAWVQINTLSYSVENPFPAEFDDFWITYLAMRLAPRFGNTPNQVTLLRAKEMLVFVRNWYHQSIEALGNGPDGAEHSWYGRGYTGDPASGRV
jgi:hypothetical protein